MTTPYMPRLPDAEFGPAPHGLPAQAAANADVLREKPRLQHVGRYQLRAPLGEGVFGGVYEAWDPLLDRTVAVKTLQFGLKMGSRIQLDRQLLQAARQLGDLSHRQLVGVHDAGLCAHGVYLALEYLSGRDMRRALDAGWRPTVAEALRIARRLADGLAYAHGRGVVHGGLEPQTVFLTTSGRPKMLNLGLATALFEARLPELADLHLGSLPCLSPEQLAGGRPSTHGDVYALGGLMFEMLSGRRPFRGDSRGGLLQNIMRGPNPDLSDLRPDLPTAVVELVRSAMAFQPEERPASAAVLSAHLRRLSNIEGQAPALSESGLTVPARLTPLDAAPPRRRWLPRWYGLGGR